MGKIIRSQEAKGHRLPRADAARGVQLLGGQAGQHMGEVAIVGSPQRHQQRQSASWKACNRTLPAWSQAGKSREGWSAARTNRWWLFDAESTRCPMTSLRDQPPGRTGLAL